MSTALTGRPGLVPQAIVPTTGAVTEIWGGSPERGEVLAALAYPPCNGIGPAARARDGKVIFSGSVQDAAVYADQRSDMGRKYSGAVVPTAGGQASHNCGGHPDGPGGRAGRRDRRHP
jgi:hypothetical protein